MNKKKDRQPVRVDLTPEGWRIDYDNTTVIRSHAGVFKIQMRSETVEAAIFLNQEQANKLADAFRGLEGIATGDKTKAEIVEPPRP